MIIRECKFSNIEDLFHYFKARKDSNSFPNGNSHLAIFESSLATLIIEDISPIEMIFLKEVSSSFAIMDFNIVEPSKLKEQFDLPDDYVDILEDYQRFIRNIMERSENRYLGFSHDIIMQHSGTIKMTINGNQLMSLIGSNIESIFYKEDKALYDNEYQLKVALEEKGGVLDKFTILFSNSFYTYMRTKLGSFDQIVADELYKNYLSKVEANSVELVKAVIPFGTSINFIPNENEETNLEDGLKAIERSVEEEMEDGIELYFALNTTFYTFFLLFMENLNLSWINLKLELLQNESIFLDHYISKDYFKRYTGIFESLLSYKDFIAKSDNSTDYFKVLLSSFNTNVRYILKVSYKDIDRFYKKIDSFKYDYRVEIEDILDSIKKDIQTIDTTVRNYKKEKDKKKNK